MPKIKVSMRVPVRNSSLFPETGFTEWATTTFFHPVQSRNQVDRSRARRCQIILDSEKLTAKTTISVCRNLSATNINAIGSSYPDSRRPAHL